MSRDDLKAYTVLVVDDEEVLRETIVFDLKRKGFTVLAANSAAAAFEMIQKQKVSVVVSDIRMPGGDGVGLLEKIRAASPELPVVILMTGFAEVSTADCMKKGARNVVAKPFDRKELMGSIFESLGIGAV